MEICKSCKNHIYISRDHCGICRHVERGSIRPYDWACIWMGEKPCDYYQPRKKGDKKHIGADDNASKAAFKRR